MNFRKRIVVWETTCPFNLVSHMMLHFVKSSVSIFLQNMNIHRMYKKVYVRRMAEKQLGVQDFMRDQTYICPFLCLDLSFSKRISRILFLPQMQELHASMRDRKFYICHEDTDTIERWCWVRNPRETLNETSCSLSFFFKRKKVNQEKKRVMSFLHEAYQKQSKGKCLLLGVFLPKKREWSSRDSFRIIFFSWQDSSS